MLQQTGFKRRDIVVVLCLIGACLCFPAGALAQNCTPSPIWPDGCTLTPGSVKPALQIWLQQGFDKIFLGACERHDRCYGQCNTSPTGPFLGTDHKFSCDLNFLMDAEAACLFWSTILTFPVDDEIVSPEDFILYCNGVLAPGVFTIFQTPLGDNAFLGSQCSNGCNSDACNQKGCALPATCGCRQGGNCQPGPNSFAFPLPELSRVCYEYRELQVPEPEFPEPGLCGFIDCCSYGCSGLQLLCCGGCASPFSPFYPVHGPGCYPGWSPWDPWYPWDPYPWDPWDPWYPWDPWDPWGPYWYLHY